MGNCGISLPIQTLNKRKEKSKHLDIKFKKASLQNARDAPSFIYLSLVYCALFLLASDIYILFQNSVLNLNSSTLRNKMIIEIT